MQTAAISLTPKSLTPEIFFDPFLKNQDVTKMSSITSSSKKEIKENIIETIVTWANWFFKALANIVTGNYKKIESRPACCGVKAEVYTVEATMPNGGKDLANKLNALFKATFAFIGNNESDKVPTPASKDAKSPLARAVETAQTELKGVVPAAFTVTVSEVRGKKQDAAVVTLVLPAVKNDKDVEETRRVIVNLKA